MNFIIHFTCLLMHPLGFHKRQQNIVLAVVSEGEAGTTWVSCHKRGRRGRSSNTETHGCYVTSQAQANGESPAISGCLECVGNSGEKLVFRSKKVIITPSEEAVEAIQCVHCWWCPGVVKQRCKCEPVEWAQLGFSLF